MTRSFPSARLLLSGATLVASLLSTAAPAQVADVTMDPFSGSDAADSVRPKTSYPLAQSDVVARSFALSLDAQQRQRDLCWELGCLVIVNASHSYEIKGFYVEEEKRDGRRGWTANQFGTALSPRRATLRFKTGGPEACDQPAMFVMRQPQTKEVLRVHARVSLCTSPHRDTLVRIDVPKVDVDGS